MSDKKNQVRETIIDGVKVIQDGNITHFIPIKDETDNKTKTQSEYKSLWKEICDWWNDDKSVKPYVKIRDFSDPFNDNKDGLVSDEGGNGSGIEIGVKFKF